MIGRTGNTAGPVKERPADSSDQMENIYRSRRVAKRVRSNKRRSKRMVVAIPRSKVLGNKSRAKTCQRSKRGERMPTRPRLAITTERIGLSRKLAVVCRRFGSLYVYLSVPR